MKHRDLRDQKKQHIIVTAQSELKKILEEFRNSNKTSSLGFVPTMGNLHEGHLSLVKESIAKNDLTVISIFVNPTQFGPLEDLNLYPRTLNQDIELVKKIDSTIIVFAPSSADEVYPENSLSYILVNELGDHFCGASRPGHFKGVCTVVYHFLRIIRPDQTYLGLKDIQQFLILQKMVKDLGIPSQLNGVPTARDNDGLALSSRNQYLSKEDRLQATIFYKILKQIEEWVLAQSAILFDQIRKTQAEIISLGYTWDYLAIASYENLGPIIDLSKNNYLELNSCSPLDIKLQKGKKYVILGALRVKQTRLIDNLIIQY